MPIGSGRFKFKSFKTATDQDDKQIVSLVLNDDRARDFHLRRFELHLYANQDKLVNGLKNSEVNAIATTTPLATSKIFNDQAFSRKVIPLNNGVFAFFNLAHDTLKDVKLRQVLRTAMNVEYLRQVIFNQDGAVSNFDLPVLKNQLAGLNTIYENNLKTSQLETTMTSLGYIKKSGSWYNKKGEKLKLDIVSVKNTQYQTIAELIAKQLRQFGCEVNLRLVDLSNNDVNVAQEIFKLKNYDILVYEINLGADPDQYGFWHSSQSNQSGLNFSNYSSKIIDDLLVTARLDSDWTLRTAKYNNFLKKWLEDVPAVGLFRSNLYYVKQKGVMGLNSDQLITPNDRYAGILDWSGEETTFYKTP